MPATQGARRARRAAVATVLPIVTLVALATPAAAHGATGGTLPVPPWLLAYLGAFVVLATAVALRATWLRPRLSGFVATAGDDRVGQVRPSQVVGVALLALSLVAAIVGPDSGAANIAPVAIFIMWWIGLPIACLLLGDVMARVNPFVFVVGILNRRSTERDGTGPSWTAAAFLGAFVWFFVAYHRPGSPRAVAVFVIAYSITAIGLGLRWGTRWLATGEAFGAISAAVALLSPWRRRTSPPPGLTALAIVWIGSTAFDGFTSTPFWADILGSSTGWQRTFLNTVGLVWLTAIVAGVHLGAQRLVQRGGGNDEPDLLDEVGVALIPLAVGWFLAHDLTLLLLEGQNFWALLSDPIGRGWDLFGTIGDTIDYTISRATWVRWAQIGALALGHIAAVVIGHDTALRHTSARRAMQVTWGLALAATVSVVSSALVVLK